MSVCAYDGCESQLASYNQSGYCQHHREYDPVRRQQRYRYNKSAKGRERIKTYMQSDQAREKQKLYKNLPEVKVRNLLQNAQRRAIARDLPFSIGKSDVVIPDTCPILGTPLDNSGGTETQPSIDRIIPELGYVPGNVWVISRKANSMKWDASPNELLAFSRFWLDKLT